MAWRAVMASWKTLSCVLLFLAVCLPGKAAPICYIHRAHLFTSKILQDVHHFNCSVTEGARASAMVWRLDGNIVKEAVGPVSWLELTLDDNTVKDSETLICEAKMEKSNVFCETTLAEPPRITTRQMDYEVFIGEPLVVVHCRSTGYPQPVLTWEKIDKSHTRLSMHPSIKWKKSRDSLDLVIKNASMIHSGVYKCQAVNRVGKATHYAVITVLYIPVSLPPRVVPLKPSITVPKGSKVVLECLATNTPRRYTALYWEHNGKRVKNTKRLLQREKFSVKIHKNIYKKENAVMSLAISHVTLKDAGVYVCGVVTHIGRGQMHVQLKVKSE